MTAPMFALRPFVVRWHRPICVGLSLLTVLACGSNSPNHADPNADSTAMVGDNPTVVESGQEPIDAPQGTEVLNEVDSLGRKQGHWVLHYRGKPWKDENYKDGVLDGLRKEHWANGEVIENEYSMGVLDGRARHYHPDSSFAMYQSFYENGEPVYLVFPWELATYIVPVKGWRAWRDSVEVKVDWLNGKHMYHGYLRVSEPDSLTSAFGMHQAYYEDGTLKATIDYDRETIVLFDRSGKVVEQTTPSRWRGKQLR